MIDRDRLLVEELCKLPDETSWVEFKHNNYRPEMIAKDICALANSSLLEERNSAYMIWGIEDRTHRIVGTTYTFQNLKKGSEELESWLRHQLSGNFSFEYRSLLIEDHMVAIIEITNPIQTPAKFENDSYIRVGSYTKPLHKFPAQEAALWSKLSSHDYESQLAETDLGLSETLGLLDYSVYFDLTKTPHPSNNEQISHYLLEDGILRKQDNGLYSITVLGALLFAKKLTHFNRLKRKPLRIVQYSGSSRIDMVRDEEFDTGYAICFENIIKYIEALTPSQETIKGALRVKRTAYPNIAIREIVANAIIHQDFSVTGSGPTVEVFDTRIDITNPGAPLIRIERIIDNPPLSRNEKLAALMRRMSICEEVGTGWDKIVVAAELYQLPAPRIEAFSNSTRVTLYSERPFANIPPEDKLWSVYMHACIKHVQGNQLTNSSLRKRFGLKDSSAGTASRLIKDAIDHNLIKPLDPTTAPRYMKYVPWWA